MSALIGPAKAARILGEQICETANDCNDAGLMSEDARMLLMAIGQAHLSAALKMEQMMREEAKAR